VLKRPHVDEYLQCMGEMYECVLFTASLAKVGWGLMTKLSILCAVAKLWSPRYFGSYWVQCHIIVFQYADPVADLLDKWGVFRARLFRESCVFHRGNYVKVRDLPNQPFSQQDQRPNYHCTVAVSYRSIFLFVQPSPFPLAKGLWVSFWKAFL